MSHHIDNLPDIFHISRIVPNKEKNRLSKETINNNSNGSDTKINDSRPSSLEIGLELREEEAKLFF